MKLSKAGALAALALSVSLVPSVGFSASVVCNTDAPNGKNYMEVPAEQVSACLAAGTGNIGDGPNDDFLNGVGAGYEEIADTSDNSLFGFTAAGDGTWSVNPDVWGSYGALAIGFKFGTGNTADEWFVYQLIKDVVSGTFTFVDVIAPGKETGAERFSHAVLYGLCDGDCDDNDLPEPGSLALLGLGLIGLGLSRRRKA